MEVLRPKAEFPSFFLFIPSYLLPLEFQMYISFWSSGCLIHQVFIIAVFLFLIQKRTFLSLNENVPSAGIQVTLLAFSH